MSGDFTCIPAPGYFGPDEFVYQANDGGTSLGTATVSINVLSTNPAPVIQSIRVATNIATLVWSTLSGRSYRLQFKSAFTNSTWTNIVPDFNATGTTLTATNGPAAGQRFYRVILLP